MSNASNCQPTKRRTHPPRGLTDRQGRVLRLMARELIGLEQARRKLGVRDATLARWMTCDAFDRELTRVVAVAGRARELALQSAGAAAATLLMRAAVGEVELSAGQHRACVELLKLVPRTSPSAPPSAPAASPVHPDLDDGEAKRLLDEIDRA